MEQPFTKPPYVIGIAGGTGSGKTTFSRELVATLMTNKIVYISHDSYYRDLSDRPFSERVKVNFDHPDSLETELLIKIISFGPLVKVVEPDSFAALIRERIERQFLYDFA